MSATSTAKSTGSQGLHALSFDVEEFFHVANLRGHFSRGDWEQAPSRIDIGMDAVLQCLARRGARATFFFLGWVAERRPDLVRRCLSEGHEIASHGYEHLFLWDLGPAGLHADLERTERALMAAGAPRPRGFRASTFTLTRRSEWAFDVLVERGYQYDSSVHPVRHPVYGMPDFPRGISVVRRAAGSLVEFPVSTLRFAGRNLPVGGGGYFRLLPGSVIRYAVGAHQAADKPACLYLHPWEFDPHQPRYPAPWHKRFRHYLNLDKTLARLDRLVSQFDFAGLEEVLQRRGALGPRGTESRT
jgi:polysaccharide deacetylase family protein (PEP-CTERM system associated)